MTVTIKFNDFLVITEMDMYEYKTPLLFRKFCLISIKGKLNILIAQDADWLWFVDVPKPKLGQPISLYECYDPKSKNFYNLRYKLMETIRKILNDKNFDNEEVERYFKACCHD
jgi:hypothetical protein